MKWFTESHDWLFNGLMFQYGMIKYDVIDMIWCYDMEWKHSCPHSIESIFLQNSMMLWWLPWIHDSSGQAVYADSNAKFATFFFFNQVDRNEISASYGIPKHFCLLSHTKCNLRIKDFYSEVFKSLTIQMIVNTFHRDVNLKYYMSEG